MYNVFGILSVIIEQYQRLYGISFCKSPHFELLPCITLAIFSLKKKLVQFSHFECVCIKHSIVVIAIWFYPLVASSLLQSSAYLFTRFHFQYFNVVYRNMHRKIKMIYFRHHITNTKTNTKERNRFKATNVTTAALSLFVFFFEP